MTPAATQRPEHSHEHSHGHGHENGHGPTHGAGTDPGGRFAARQRRLAFATGLNVAIVVGQAVAGALLGSVALLADAGHNLSDAAGVAFALVALRLARRAPSATRTFGGLRWPVLAAQANAAAVLVVTALLTVQAISRLAHPSELNGLAVAAVALLAAAGNGVSALAVHERHGDLNTRAAVLHLAADAAVSVAVALAGAVIWLVDGWYWLDPAASLVVSALIAAHGVRLLAQSSRVLLEATPPGVDMAALRADVLAVEGVTGVHDVHVWGLSDQVAAASAHVEVAGHPTLEAAREVADRVKLVLAQRHGVAHATLEAECEPCGPAEQDPCGVTRVDHRNSVRHAHSHG